MEVQELRAGLWRWTADHPEWDHAEHWGPQVGSVYAELPDAVVVGDLLVGKGGEIEIELPVEWFPKAEQDWVREHLKPSLRERLGALPIELVLVSHGDPVLSGGAEALERALSPGA